MISRYGFALAIGTAVTFGLLFIMQLLIASDRGPLLDGPSRHVLDFVRVERPPEIVTRREDPRKPPEPDRPPEMTDSNDPGSLNTGIAVSLTAPNIQSGVRTQGIGMGIADGEYLPIVKVEPAYPTRARTLGLGGYATVEYTVTRTGTTKDVRVVESSNRVFERPCAAAAASFKYKPRVIGGEAVEVPGVQNRCTFEIDE